MIQRSRPRVPGYIYAAISLGLVILIAAVTLTARQPPPPSIAEFAPQAIQQIKESIADQSSRVGGGIGSETAGLAGVPPPPPTANEPIEVARVRKCVGDPPRQIEDPQSPPCVPYWSGDNGGATYKGVTKDEIRIATPSNTASDFNLTPAVIDAVEAFFNKRFEFYGRKINLIDEPRNAGGSDPEPAQRNFAIDADEQRKVFAATAYRNAGGEAYHDEFARRGIFSAMGFELTLPRERHELRRPYLWAYDMAADDMFRNIGQWICARLAGQPAIHGDPSFRLRTRRFGLLMAPHPRQSSAARPSKEPLLEVLKTCGATPVYSEDANRGANGGGLDPDGYGDYRGLAQSTMLAMRRNEVTTIICLCSWQYAEASTMPAATSQSYYPEWIFSSFGNLDNNVTMKVGAGHNPAQVAHAFGLTFRPRLVPLEHEPYMKAVREVNPALAADPNEHQTLKIYAAQEFYRSLLLLASGIQMAGPKLTPHAVEQALQRTRFPNPPDPTFPGKVGFSPGSHAMMLDGAEWWWGVNAPSPYAGDTAGSFCYVERGARRQMGQWPQGDNVFFQGECSST